MLCICGRRFALRGELVVVFVRGRRAGFSRGSVFSCLFLRGLAGQEALRWWLCVQFRGLAVVFAVLSR